MCLGVCVYVIYVKPMDRYNTKIKSMSIACRPNAINKFSQQNNAHNNFPFPSLLAGWLA